LYPGREHDVEFAFDRLPCVVNNLFELAAVDRVQSFFSREIAQPRKTPSYRGDESRLSHPNRAGWRRRIRHGSLIGSDLIS